MEAVETVAVDKRWRHISGSEEIIPCDTLLLSVGLIPENELSRQAGVILDQVTNGPVVDSYFHTSIEGIFAAGNVVHVYDLVDWVTKAGYTAGKGAALRYIVPHRISPIILASSEIPLQMRVVHPIEAPIWVEARAGDNLLVRQPMRYVRPGEMITIMLKPKHAGKIKSAYSITIDIIKR